MINIPFFSQLDESVPLKYQRHVCALACIKMIFDTRNIKNSFEDIYNEAEIVGGRESEGWTHETIIRIFRNHGISAYRQEFLGHDIDIQTRTAQIAKHTERFVKEGILKIKKSIDKSNPVLVSVKPGFSENKDHHVVLIIGYEEDSFIILDPILDLEQNPKKVSLQEFGNFWKKFAIFVE